MKKDMPQILLVFVLSILSSSVQIILLYYLSVDSLSYQGPIINLVTATVIMAMSFQRRYFDLRGSMRDLTSVTIDCFRNMRTSTRKEKGRFVGMAFIAMVIIAAVIAWSLPQNDEPYTELYLLGQNGKAMNYITNLTCGSVETFRIGVANHENERMTYYLQAWFVDMDLAVDNVTVNRMFFAGEVTITLGDKELSGYEDWEPQWEYDMKVTANRTGNFRLFFLLFKDWVPAVLCDPVYEIDYTELAGKYVDYAMQNEIQNVYLIVNIIENS